MADTSAQHRAEEWVVSQFLPKHFKAHTFVGRKLTLKWGGEFAFDAVSEDGKIVGLVSTGASRTETGRPAIGKYLKLKADALYLLNVKGAMQLFMVFTEESMLKHFEKERQAGRFPPQIDLLYARLPASIHTHVLRARRAASVEVSPNMKAWPNTGTPKRG